MELIEKIKKTTKPFNFISVPENCNKQEQFVYTVNKLAKNTELTGLLSEILRIVLA